MEGRHFVLDAGSKEFHDVEQLNASGGSFIDAHGQLFRQLAESERDHAEIWGAKLREHGIDAVTAKPSFKTRVLRLLIRQFGPRFVLPALAAAELADRSKYADQPDAEALSADERSHAAVVAAAAQRGQVGGVTGAEIARRDMAPKRFGQ